ncbi:MAG: hypothetical protein ACXWKM_13480 [Phenylobacterium sp.]
MVLTVAAPLLAACGTMGSADFQHFMDGVKEIASDPNCGHTDRIQGNLGGVTGNNLAVYLERTCPARGSVTAPAPTPPAPLGRG